MFTLKEQITLYNPRWEMSFQYSHTKPTQKDFSKGKNFQFIRKF